MKILCLLTCSVLACASATAQPNYLELPGGTKFAAIFPCASQPASAAAASGTVNALRCNVESSSSACDFIIAEQPLNLQAYGQSGFAFIEEVHRQYAKAMDPNFTSKLHKVTTQNGLGKVLDYELNRTQQGYVLFVKGKWLVAGNRTLRATYSCFPANTNFMQVERALFLESLTLIK